MRQESERKRPSAGYVRRLGNALAPTPEMRSSGKLPGPLRIAVLATLALIGMTYQLFDVYSRMSGS